MIRERSEIISFTRDDLERIVRHIAQLQITGHLFIGKLGEQEVHWLGDGAGVEVVTRYQQGGFEDLPPPSTELTVPVAKKRRR
jgi:hypothetical protein